MVELENSTFLDNENTQNLIDLFLNNINAAEVLEKVHPQLKTLYDNRLMQYAKSKQIENTISKNLYYNLCL